MRKKIFISGVNSGIGKALCAKLLTANWEVWGSYRPNHDVNHIQQLFQRSPFFHPVPMDMSNESSIAAGINQIKATPKLNFDALVHNAGYVLPGSLTNLPLTQMREQMQVNFFSVYQITQGLLPLLKEKSKILVLSSTSAHIGFPFIGPYCASKHAIRGLFESMRREFKLLNIDVIQISPGPVQTPIWDKTALAGFLEPKIKVLQYALKKFKTLALDSGKKGLKIDSLIINIEKILDCKSPKSEYFFVVNPLSFLIQKILPKGILDKMITNKLSS